MNLTLECGLLPVMDGSFEPKAFVRRLPHLPGVYRMLGPRGEVLYVGKAGDLRKRVGSYFSRPTAQSPRVQMMLSQVASIEVTVTRSEDEALLLENNLIKSLAPRYNILFRDDKSYPYLVISGHAFPRIGFHRGARAPESRYFGPFPHAYAVREAIQLLQRVFRLRTCEDSVFENRARPCLLHQIRRCTAPCTGQITQDAYREDVRHAELFLQGREDDVVRSLSDRMSAEAGARHYEQAAILRDQVRALTRVQARQYVESERGVDGDVVASAVDGGMVCVNLVMIRGGRHIGDRSFFPANADGASASEIITAFLEQHYVDHPVPRLVLTSEAVDREALGDVLAQRAPQGTQVLAPQQGERRMWLEMARKNAELALTHRAQERATQEGRLAGLREALGLADSVERIECFDVSHTMGEAAVASCVVYDRQAMQKSEYRRFNIRDVAPGDDYAAMRQALRRRYERLAVDGGKIPDLILIDGGLGQVNAARGVLAELGLSDVSIVGVAKGPERKPGLEQLVVEAEGRTLRLPAHDRGLHLVQSIRDEAHRFALLGHRARRGRARTSSSLIDFPGIGDKRRQRLLAHFGGLRGVQSAAVDEIAQVEGISRTIAERIYRTLHDQGQS
jgi:excinuclease ABC subunit C